MQRLILHVSDPPLAHWSLNCPKRNYTFLKSAIESNVSTLYTAVMSPPRTTPEQMQRSKEMQKLSP